jgi:hypothetical protein
MGESALEAFTHHHIHFTDPLDRTLQVATMINCALTTVTITGPPLPPGPPSAEALNKITMFGSVGVTVAIVAQSLSKVSFGLTLIPLCQGWLRRFVWTAIILINVFFGLGGLFQWVGCRPLRKSWQPLTPGTCLPADFNANFGIFVSGELAFPFPMPPGSAPDPCSFAPSCFHS